MHLHSLLTSRTAEEIVHVIRNRLGCRHRRRELAGVDNGCTALLHRANKIAVQPRRVVYHLGDLIAVERALSALTAWMKRRLLCHSHFYQTKLILK